MLQFAFELISTFFEDHKDSIENEDYAYFRRIIQAILDDLSTSFDQLVILVLHFLLGR
jgi:hypothetical protein